MNVPWDAIALTVRQTAPGLLICASVLIASLLVLQAWSTMVGVGVGAIAAVLAGAHGNPIITDWTDVALWYIVISVARFRSAVEQRFLE